MKIEPLTSTDELLIDQAKEVLTNYYHPNRHRVGAALLTKSGSIFTSVHLGAAVGRASICAEPIALGKAISEGEHEFEAIVAVMRSDKDDGSSDIYVVPPCGVCRELLSEYGPNMQVIFADDGELKKSTISELLPAKFKPK